MIFFRAYTEKAFRLVDDNLELLAGLDMGIFNTFYEQHLFYCMARQRQTDICFYLDNVNELFDGLVDFTGVEQKLRYLHTGGILQKTQGKRGMAGVSPAGTASGLLLEGHGTAYL